MLGQSRGAFLHLLGWWVCDLRSTLAVLSQSRRAASGVSQPHMLPIKLHCGWALLLTSASTVALCDCSSNSVHAAQLDKEGSPRDNVLGISCRNFTVSSACVKRSFCTMHVFEVAKLLGGLFHRLTSTSARVLFRAPVDEPCFPQNCQ